MILGIKKYFFALLCVFIGSISANPKGAEVISGNVSVAANNKALLVSASDKAIIHWQDFSIKANESTKFIQPSSKATVLNRVVGDNMSSILGNLEANGHVFLINPSGIIVGKDAVIDTAAFTASALNLSDEDFLKNSSLLFEGLTKSSVINYGTINAWDGDVTLLGYKIENHGHINTLKGNTTLAIGQTILLKPEAEEKIFIRPNLSEMEKKEESGIINTGNISAIQTEIKADGNPYLYAIKHSGKINSYGIEKKEGKVLIVAEKSRVEISGDVISKNKDGTSGDVRVLGQEICLLGKTIIDVSSEKGEGIVLIGGDYKGKNPSIYNAKLLYVSPETIVDASAKNQGNGGKIIFWADQENQFYGTAISEGGKIAGDGGIVEVSSPGNLIYKGKVHCSATHGDNGNLFLDPGDVNLGNHGGVGTSNPAFPTTPPGTYDPLAAPGNLDYADITPVLNAGTNVFVQTAGGAWGTGDITISAGFSWTGAGILNCTADNDIIVNAGITITMNGGGMNFTATRDIIVNAGASLFAPGVGGIVFAASRDITINAGALIAPASGGVSFTAAGNINIYGNVQATAPSVGANFMRSTGGNITIGDGVNFANASTDAGNLTLQTDVGDLTINGSNTGANGQAHSNAGTVTCNIANDLNINGGGGGLGGSGSVSTSVSTININVGNDLYLQGGTGHTCRAYIYTTTGTINVDVANNLKIYGGGGAQQDNYAGIEGFGIANIIIGATTAPIFVDMQAGNATNGGSHSYIKSSGTCSITTSGPLPNGKIILDARTGTANTQTYIDVNALTIDADALEIYGGNAGVGNNYAYIECNPGNFVYDTVTVPTNKGGLLLEPGIPLAVNNSAYINVWSPGNTNSLTLRIHDPTLSSNIVFNALGKGSPAYINAPSMTLYCDNLTMTAGNAGANAVIQSTNGAVSLDVQNDLNMTGGAQNSKAEITYIGGGPPYPSFTMNVVNNATLLAGAGTLPADDTDAAIYNFGSANVQVLGTLTLTGSAGPGIGDAYMDFTDLSAPIITNTTSITGGASANGSRAYIDVTNATTGNLLLQAPGGLNLTGGTNNANNEARLWAGAGVTINPVGNVQVIANAGTAYIRAGSGPMSITSTGSYTLTGGSTTAAHAEMFSGSTTDLTLSGVNMTLTSLGGGAGPTYPYAGIHTFNNADINLTGSLSLQAGAASNSGSVFISANQIAGGNSIRADSITLNGGDGPGPSIANAVIQTFGGDLTLETITGGILIQTSNLPGASSSNTASIEALSPATDSVHILQGAGTVNINARGNNAPNGGAHAYIRGYNVNIGTTAPVGGLRIAGGVDPNGNAYAFIDANNDVSLACGNVDIIGGVGHQNNYAEILCGRAFQTIGAGVGNVTFNSNLHTQNGYARILTNNLGPLGTFSMTANSIIIYGGDGTMGNGYGAIETSMGSYPNCTITTSGNLSILGGINAGDAHISNYTITSFNIGGSLILTGNNNDGRAYITVNNVTGNITANDIQMTAGNGAGGNAMVYINSNNNLTLITTVAGISLTAGNTHTGNIASLYSGGLLTINSATDLSLTADWGDALIQSGTGGANITCGNNFSLLGGNVANSKAYLTSMVGVQPLVLNVTNDATLEGGIAANADAYITNYNNADIDIGNNLNIWGSTPLGGNGPAYIRIDSLAVGQNLVTNSLNIKAGNDPAIPPPPPGTGAFAELNIQSGDLRLEAPGGISVKAQSTASGYALLTASNNIDIGFPGTPVGNISVTGQADKAQILGGTSTTYMSIESTGTVTLQGGTAFNSQAEICGGFNNPNLTMNLTGGTSDLLITSGDTDPSLPYAGITQFNNVNISVARNITLTGNPNANAGTALIYSNALLTISSGLDTKIDANVGQAFIQSGTGGANITSGNDFTINAGSNGATAYLWSGVGVQPLIMNITNDLNIEGGTGVGPSDAYISNFGNANITVGGILKIQASPATSDGKAYLYLNSLAAPLTTNQTRILGGTTAGNAAYAELFITAGNLTLLAPAGVDITGGQPSNYARITASGDIAIGTSGSPVGQIQLTGAGSYAKIEASGTTNLVSIESSSNVILQGGTGSDSGAEIYRIGGLPYPTLTMNVTGNLTLTGGNSAGPPGGQASINTFDNVDITVVGNLIITGGAGANGAPAYINIEKTAVAGSISAGNIRIIGGVSPAANSSAFIQANNGDLTLSTSGGNIDLRSSAGGSSTNYAAIECWNGDIIIGPAGSVALLPLGAAPTYIRNNNQDIYLGTATNSIFSLTIAGGTDAGGLSSSYVDAVDVFVNTGGGLINMTGGSGHTNNVARINCSGSFQSVGTLGNINITGGSGANAAPAEIVTITSFNVTAANILMNGGANNTYARIWSTANPNFTCNLSGNMILNGGTNNSDAYITNYTFTNATIANTFRLQGNNASSGRAYIVMNDVTGSITASQIEVLAGDDPAGGSNVYINSGNRLTMATTGGDLDIKGGLQHNNNFAYVIGSPLSLNINGDVNVGDVLKEGSAFIYSSILGSTINVTGNLTLQGGNNNGHAEIRTSGGPSTPLNLTVGGNVTLKGGTGAGAPIASINNHNNANVNITGTLWLEASTATSQGEASIDLDNLSSNFRAGNIIIDGGTSAGVNAHARIFISSGSLTLEAPGGIAITGGNKASNYAKIFSSSDMSIGTSLSRVGNVNITGGTGGGPADIEIGPGASSFSLWSSGTVALQGGPSAGSEARIFCSGAPFPNLTTMDVQGNVTIDGGGLGVAGGWASIDGFDNANTNIAGSLDIRGSNNVNGLNAFINVERTAPGGSIRADSINLTGGFAGTGTSQAYIMANVGDVSLETISGDLILLSQGGNIGNSASIQSLVGSVNFLRGGELRVTATTGAPAYASGASFSIGTAGPVSRVTLNAGSEAGGNSNVYLNANSGNFTVGTVSGPFTLNGGTVHQNNTAKVYSQGNFTTTGSIGSLNVIANFAAAEIETWNNFSYNGGPCAINGGAIGTSIATIFTTNPAFPNFSFTSSGNVRIRAGVLGDANIQGYTFTNVNIAGNLLIESSNSSTGDAFIVPINVTGTIAANSIDVRAGTSAVAGASAYITGINNLSLTTTSGNIEVTGSANQSVNNAFINTATGSITLQSAADIRLFSDLSLAYIDSFANISATANGQVYVAGGNEPAGAAPSWMRATNGNLTIQAGSVDVVGGTAHIGNYAEIIAAGTVNINTATDLRIQASVIAPSRITAGSSLFCQAGDNFIMDGLTQLSLAAAGNDLRALAGNDMILTDNAIGSPVIQNNSGAGPLYLVVDNDNPAFPFIGTGSYNQDVGVTVTTGGGPLYVYTARQGLNTITGLLNGVAYVPGPEFQNSLTEEWFHYYPNSPGGFPFTIYYKDFADEMVILHEGIVQGLTALTEMNRMLHEYSEYIKLATEFEIHAKEGPFIKKIFKDLYEIPQEIRSFFIRKKAEPNEVKIIEQAL